MKFRLLVLCVLAVAASSASAGEVKLQLTNGRVTLQAKDASVREILAEWQRIGQVKIVNADKVAGAPLTLDLRDVPESQALNTVLRSVSGYLASPRPTGNPASSNYEQIIVMWAPRSVGTSSYATPSTQLPQSQYPYRGMPPGMSPPAQLDDQDQPVGPPPTYPGGYPGSGPGAAGAAPNTAPQAPVPGQVPQGAPGTVSPMPQQMQPGTPGGPGQQVLPGTGAPGAVTPPVRRPPGAPGGEGGEGGREK